jgi:hypothetical protein
MTGVTTPLTLAVTKRIVSTRRRFLARLGLGSAAFVTVSGASVPAQAQAVFPTPRRHPVDDWMDALPSTHRMMFDAVSAAGLEDIRHYASNFFNANRTGYALEPRDIGVLVVLRHSATPYGFADAMWAKYGDVFAAEMKIAASKTNPVLAGGEGLDALSRNGAYFGVCAMATRYFAGLAARGTGTSTDAVVDELGKNLIGNAHLTPAGIVAVGRAQERGFMFGYAG